MQLSDVLYWLYTATGIVTLIIVGAVTFRALEIRRVLVGPTYRRRASWSAALMVISIISVLTSPNTGLTSAPFFYTPLGSVLTTLPLLLTFIGFYAFVDSNVLASIAIDFFHRNTLRWRQVRAPFYGIMLFVIALIIAYVYANPTNQLGYNSTTVILLIIIFGGIGLVLGYSSVALLVVARRTPDLTLRKFIRLAGIGLVLFVISSIVWIMDAFIAYLGDAISGFFIIISTFIFYKAVMSLSSVGKLEKEIDARK